MQKQAVYRVVMRPQTLPPQRQSRDHSAGWFHNILYTATERGSLDHVPKERWEKIHDAVIDAVQKNPLHEVSYTVYNTGEIALHTKKWDGCPVRRDPVVSMLDDIAEHFLQHGTPTQQRLAIAAKTKLGE